MSRKSENRIHNNATSLTLRLACGNLFKGQHKCTIQPAPCECCAGSDHAYQTMMTRFLFVMEIHPSRIREYSLCYIHLCLTLVSDWTKQAMYALGNTKFTLHRLSRTLEFSALQQYVSEIRDSLP